MFKHVLAYDTQDLKENEFNHNEVRKSILRFLIRNGAVIKNIKEPVQTTFTFESKSKIETWQELINKELLLEFKKYMSDFYYYLGSIKSDEQNRFIDRTRSNSNLQTTLNELIKQIENE